MSRHTTLALALAFAAGAPAVASAQTARDLLKVHGYLTQGYVDATQLPYAGIPTDGTADYRSAALQLRSDFTKHDQLTVQLRHFRMGSSVLNEGTSPVELAWAFYEHTFPARVKVKVGRMPMVRGIYNQIRSVGTVLPFYRAPLSVYSEGQENIDGASVAGSFDVAGGFSVDLTGYTGRFKDESATYPKTGLPTVRRRTMANTFGAQTWLNTPIPGVRVGLGGLRYTRLADPTSASTTGNREESRWTASVDASRSRYTLRSEFSHVVSSYSKHQGYVQATANVFRGFSVSAQEELGYRIRFAPTKTTVNGVTTLTPPVRQRELQDLALGAKYAIGDHLALKLEQHQVRGTRFDQYMSSTAPEGRSRYTVASIATSF